MLLLSGPQVGLGEGRPGVFRSREIREDFSVCAAGLKNGTRGRTSSQHGEEVQTKDSLIRLECHISSGFSDPAPWFRADATPA